MVARFEAAVDALIEGDVDRLDDLLTEMPALVHARLTRRHQATLLHYVGANGVEGFRQHTPRTIVQAAALLLDRGADIDARAPIYGGSATLGLIATSIHPARAGVLEPLVELFLDYGAADDPALVAGCLANGRGQAATLLARRGAHLTLEGAAGVGRLDEVRRFFTTDGHLRPDATPQQRLDGFAWACEFGHSLVVDFLLQHGVAVDARVKHHGQTGLHWAAAGGHLATVRVLLARRAPVDAPDATWGNTPIGWALHGWGDDDHSAAGRARYHAVVAALVAAGADVKPEWRTEPRVKADPGMLAALGG